MADATPEFAVIAQDDFASSVASAPTWSSRSSVPGLEPRQIHLWREMSRPAEISAAAQSSLSARERERARTFHFAVDRDRYLARQVWLRRRLAAYVGAEPGELEFAYGERGKPSLRDVRASGLEFNLSHSDDLTYLAVAARVAVGIDVEVLRELPEAESIARRFIPAEQAAAWAPLDRGEQSRRLLRLWTRHEAVNKATGIGVGGEWIPTAAERVLTFQCEAGTGIDGRRVAAHVVSIAFC